MGAISNVIEKVGDDELGIINFNYLKDRLRRWNDKLPQPGEEVNHPYRFCEARKPDDIDKEITRGMVQYFGGHMYRLKEEPTNVMSDAKPDYEYFSKRRGKNTVYTLVASESLTEFARDNHFDTNMFRNKFLRKHAMTTIDSTGCGKRKDELNGDVYIVGWRLVDGLDSTEYNKHLLQKSESIKQIGTSDGKSLIFNIYIDSTPLSERHNFPNIDTLAAECNILPLAKMSSTLPELFHPIARKHNPTAAPNYRALCYNAVGLSIIPSLNFCCKLFKDK
jgi:hypothetical protein